METYTALATPMNTLVRSIHSVQRKADALMLQALPAINHDVYELAEGRVAEAKDYGLLTLADVRRQREAREAAERGEDDASCQGQGGKDPREQRHVRRTNCCQ